MAVHIDRVSARTIVPLGSLQRVGVKLEAYRRCRVATRVIQHSAMSPIASATSLRVSRACSGLPPRSSSIPPGADGTALVSQLRILHSLRSYASLRGGGLSNVLRIPEPSCCRSFRNGLHSDAQERLKRSVLKECAKSASVGPLKRVWGTKAIETLFSSFRFAKRFPAKHSVPPEEQGIFCPDCYVPQIHHLVTGAVNSWEGIGTTPRSAVTM